MIDFFLAAAAGTGVSTIPQENVIPIWGDQTVAPMNGGFVSNISQQTIFQPNQAGDKVYNHHVRMALLGSRIYLTRSTHDFREDGGGQHSWFTYSDDEGVTWAAWQVLVPQGSDMFNENPIVNGVTIFPHYTFSFNNKLYALHYYLDRNNIWGNELIAEIENGVVVDRFYLFDNGSQPVVGAYPVYSYDSEKSPELISELQRTTNIGWYRADKFGFPATWVNPFMEFSGIINPNGFESVILRELGNGRYDKAYSYKDGGEWTDIQNISIPDCVSGSTTVWKRYGDDIYMSGNDAATGGDYRRNAWISKAKYWDLDFNEAKEIVRNIDNTIVYPGTNKNGGYAYFDFVKIGTKIVHAGSRAKEDIYVYVFDDF